MGRLAPWPHLQVVLVRMGRVKSPTPWPVLVSTVPVVMLAAGPWRVREAPLAQKIAQANMSQPPPQVVPSVLKAAVAPAVTLYGPPCRGTGTDGKRI